MQTKNKYVTSFKSMQSVHRKIHVAIDATVCFTTVKVSKFAWFVHRARDASGLGLLLLKWRDLFFSCKHFIYLTTRRDCPTSLEKKLAFWVSLEVGQNRASKLSVLHQSSRISSQIVSFLICTIAIGKKQYFEFLPVYCFRGRFKLANILWLLCW